MPAPSLAEIVLYFTWASGVAATQPWLNTSLPYEERLTAFIAQLNDTQKFAMVQGDTVVSSLTRSVSQGRAHS